jgi:hypothetical protein
MKILVIIISHDFSKRWCDNIAILHKFMQQITSNVYYAGICSSDDFHIYEDIISFQYKIINPKRQFSKICDFITEYKNELDYDWYIKIRPEVFLFENIPFNQLSNNAINARSRYYIGPRQIPYGSSISGIDFQINYYCRYDTYEHDIILDDHLFIFHKNVINHNAFDTYISHDTDPENETMQSTIWKSRNIGFHVIGIHMVMQKYNYYSGHIHIPKPQPKRHRPRMFFS